MKHVWGRFNTPEDNHPHWMELTFICQECGCKVRTTRFHIEGKDYINVPPREDELGLYGVAIDCNEELVRQIMIS